VYLAAALQGSPADVTRRICARLTLSPRIAETLTGGIAAVERAAHRLQSALEVPPSQIVAALQMVPLDLLPLLMGTSPEREAHERIRQYLRTLRHVQPSLSGHDLKRLGVPQGPLIGRVLTRVRAAKLDGEAPTREAEESVVRNAVAQEGTMPQSCL
jgi:tRNA nucleotidyltransferase (CCA-adding enzyme)